MQFVGGDRKRRTIRLGKVTQKMAEGFKYRVEALNAAKIAGLSVDAETAQWITQRPPSMQRRLAKVGFVDEQIFEADKRKLVATLGTFLAEYFARRTDVKPATKINWGHTRRNLLDFFTADKPIADFTVADAKDFERHLKGTARENACADREKAEPLRADTVRKRISNCKQFFEDAKERKRHMGVTGGEPYSKTSQKRKTFDACSTHVATLERGVQPDIAQAEWGQLIQFGRSLGLSDEKLVLLVDVVERLPEQIPAKMRTAVITLLADPWLLPVVERWQYLSPEKKAEIIELAGVFEGPIRSGSQ